ncbi:MAG: hypothetical protein HND57_00315 [Planctomycetes bacterium]|nr:hypothetical protein [Planctomycetota bacterium]
MSHMTKPIRMYCRNCRYPLNGLRDTVCPECGQAFDPADEKTFATSERREFPFQWEAVASAICAVSLILLLTQLGRSGPSWRRPSFVDEFMIWMVPITLAALSIGFGISAMRRGAFVSRLLGAVGCGLGSLFCFVLISMCVNDGL